MAKKIVARVRRPAKGSAPSRERSAVVAWLIQHDSSRPERSFQHQLVTSNEGDIRRHLLGIADRLKTQFPGNPFVKEACGEIWAKAFDRPDELDASAKLFRAIDDLECLASQLQTSINELRALSGWSEGDEDRLRGLVDESDADDEEWDHG